MDRFESMIAFVAVARAGGFSAAARATGVPVATVSRKVAELEHALGARLFQRSTRQVALSESGKVYFAAVTRILDDVKDAEGTLTGEYRTPKGELTVTAPVGFGRMHLQPVITEFLAAYPEIDLRLLLVDRVVNLLEEHVDLAVRIASLPDSTLVARQVGTIRVVVVGNPDYLARRGKPRHPDDLIDHDCVSWAGLGTERVWSFRVDGRARDFPIHSRLTTTTSESAIAAAMSGVGLARVTSYQAEEGMRSGTLVRVLTKFEPEPMPVSLVYPSSRLAPLKLRALLDFCVPRLTARLHGIESAIGTARRSWRKANSSSRITG